MNKQLSIKTLTDELEKVEPDLLGLSDHGPDAVPILAKIFRDVGIHPRIREKAVYVLGILPGDTSDLIREAAGASEVRLRRAAAATAANLGPEHAGPILAQLIEDRDATVRHIAANHLPVPSRRTMMTNDVSAEKVKSGSSVPRSYEPDGPEIAVTTVRFQQKDLVRFQFYVRNSNARVRIYRVIHQTQRQILVDEENKNEIGIDLPDFPSGQHLLYWSFQRVGLIWQTCAELNVNGICRFRHRKDSDGSDPVNKGFLFLEVDAAKIGKSGRSRRGNR